MRNIQGMTFELLDDRDSGAVFSDCHFDRCVFDNCQLSKTTSPKLRSRVCNATLVNCVALGSDVGPAILENVTVDGLRIGGILILWSPVFKHVTLKGKIGGELKINAIVSLAKRDPETQGQFDIAASEFYKNVDWALDISEAEFNEFDMCGIPVSLVRRDPKTQIVVTHKKAIQAGWRQKVAPWNDYWPRIIDMSVAHGEKDTILVAPKGKRKSELQKLVDGLRNLQDIGVAEPD